MFARPRLLATTRFACHALAAALACAGASACKGGGSSPNSPSGPGNTGSSCRTVGTTQRSVQTFIDGQQVTTDMACTFNGSTDVVCNNTFFDNRGGPGTGVQTSRFASRSDLVDEASVNPPKTLSLGTTTVLTVGGVSFTTTATNSYDAQRRLVSTRIANPAPLGGETTLTYSAWDSSGRPTAGTFTPVIGGQFPISITYDNAARTSRRNTGLNICTQTHDQNGNIVREECTGTTPSTTVVTIQNTQQICK